MKTYVTFTKKTLFVLSLLLVCFLLVYNDLYYAINIEDNASTNAKRLNYLKEAGYIVLSDEPQTQIVTLPNSFHDVYVSYNALQLKSGYDLSAYKGCETIIYTYQITAPVGYEGECLANIIVYNNRIIGGDISSAGYGGYILPLNYANKNR